MCLLCTEAPNKSHRGNERANKNRSCLSLPHLCDYICYPLIANEEIEKCFSVSKKSLEEDEDGKAVGPADIPVDV